LGTRRVERLTQTQKPTANSPQQAPKPLNPAYLFFAARNFAQRLRAAAAILFLPAAEIFRVGFAGAEAVTTVGFDPFRACAHRFCCAKLIFLRADADNVRWPFEPALPKAASAAVNRWTSCCALASSFFN
jgi:hypothetical protein